MSVVTGENLCLCEYEEKQCCCSKNCCDTCCGVANCCLTGKCTELEGCCVTGSCHLQKLKKYGCDKCDALDCIICYKSE